MIKLKLQILLSFLKDEAYQQKEIVDKLNILGVKISKSSFNIIFNLRKNEESGKTVSRNLIKKVVAGLEEIIKLEKGLIYDENSQSLVSNNGDWVSTEIKIESIDEKYQENILIHEKGRKTVNSKVELINRTQKDFIELGVRLKTFSSHFFDDNEHVYKLPIINKLNEGINFRCFVLNPRGRFAADYFMDRAKVQPEEGDAFQEMKNVFERLKMIRDEVNSQSQKGKMEIYLLNSYPYLHASISDGDLPNGKMFIAHYLYGVSRANSPVFEFDKKNNPIFYKKYWTSIKKTINNAVLVK